MKKTTIILSLSTLAVLAACGNESVNNENTAEADNAAEESGENTPDAENEADEPAAENTEETNMETEETENNSEAEGNEEEAAEEIAEDGWETEVGETIENEGGTFTLHARQDEIDTVETGPVVMEITQVNAASGELAPDLAEMMETEELDYIQMDVEVENTADEDITFYASQATISTSTGEQLEQDLWLSDHIDGELMAGTSHSGSFFFVLENSQAEEVESLRAVWSAPHDEDWEDLGEEVDIEIEF
ncbi:DUF4352 domain-containing protein [Alkalicoccus daliensis]|uniref:DUF4352 domain-containing protein n=1 Tax=Alkalicoccus daliensis TaxID=745820 RepID=A0A1H0HG29_9BACI|nr:DUF4352 domain-containing protein [Alkalicoccus daliensis]SDO18118.1 protein of unknown function [Alkalicoccus daliensis]